MGRCSKYLNMGMEDLLNVLNIKIIEDVRMSDKENDAVLITGINTSIIYLKENLISEYKKFLILHECGHRILHFQENGKYSYIQSCYCGRLEQEANIFACKVLLMNKNLDGVNIIDLLMQKGVPKSVAINYFEKQRNQ